MYRKLRYYLRFYQALIFKYRLFIIVGAIIAALIFFGGPLLIKYTPRIRPTQKIGLVGRYTLTNLPLSIQEQISIGLTTIDSSGIPSAAIAQDWVATDSGKTYIFTLNPNLHWQDGQPVKSPDIKYNFKDAEVTYPDDSHIMFKLQDPFSPLPTIVSRPVFRFLPSHGLFSQPTLIGIGQYKISSYHRNGNLLENIRLSPVRPDSQLPHLQYNFYSSSQQVRTAFKLGLLDGINNLSELGELANWPNVKITSIPQTEHYIAAFFNTQDPQFQGQSGRSLRIALSYAVDKSRWQNLAHGPIPNSSWANTSDIRTYDYDLEKAESSLKRVEKTPESLSLVTTPGYLEVAEIVKSDWEKLGLKIELTVSQDIPENYQILLFAQSVPTDPDQYNLWHSTQITTNLTHLNNPRIDKLLEDGRKTFDPKTRTQLYHDFQKYLMDEAPAAFLYYPQNFNLTRD